MEQLTELPRGESEGKALDTAGTAPSKNDDTKDWLSLLRKETALHPFFSMLEYHACAVFDPNLSGHLAKKDFIKKHPWCYVSAVVADSALLCIYFFILVTVVMRAVGIIDMAEVLKTCLNK